MHGSVALLVSRAGPHQFAGKRLSPQNFAESNSRLGQISGVLHRARRGRPRKCGHERIGSIASAVPLFEGPARQSLPRK